MFTKEDILAYKAKAEADLTMAQARVEVYNELLSVAAAREQISIEETDTCDTVSVESATDNTY